MKSQTIGAYLFVLPSLVLLGLVSVAAWATHVVNCIIAGKWLLLIAGAIAAPVGVIHGVGIWFGFWP